MLLNSNCLQLDILVLKCPVTSSYVQFCPVGLVIYQQKHIRLNTNVYFLLVLLYNVVMGNKIDPGTGLTEKQRRFCEEYIKVMNGQLAAENVGYKKESARSQASRLLTNNNIIEYLKTLKDVITEDSIISARQVLLDIKAIGDRCMQTEPVLDKLGNKTGEYVFKENGALKSRELLGKYHKLFAERVSHENPDGSEMKQVPTNISIQNLKIVSNNLNDVLDD